MIEVLEKSEEMTEPTTPTTRAADCTARPNQTSKNHTR